MTAITLLQPARRISRVVLAMVILAVVASAWLVVRTVHSTAAHANRAGVSHLGPAAPLNSPAQPDRWICRVNRPC